MVEDLVEQHWSTVTLSSDRLDAVRRLVLEHMDTLLPNQDRAEAEAKRSLADLSKQSERLMQAFYVDAITLDHLKSEQARISSARAEAEALITRNTTDRGLVLEKLDYLCALLARPMRYYENAPDGMRRELNQSVFDRIYVFDDEIVGSDLTEPAQRLLSESLELDLARDRKRVQTTHVRTSDLDRPTEVGISLARGAKETGRNVAQDASLTRLGAFLAVERPRGEFPWERKNPGPFKVRGSNDHFLVDLIHLCSTNSDLPFTTGQLREMAQPGAESRGALTFEAHQIGKRLGKERRTDLIQRYEAGEAAQALADEFKVSKSALLALLRRHNIVVRQRSLTQEQIAVLVRGYESGKTVAQLEEEVGITHGPIQRALVAAGVTMRPRGRRPSIQ